MPNNLVNFNSIGNIVSATLGTNKKTGPKLHKL